MKNYCVYQDVDGNWIFTDCDGIKQSDTDFDKLLDRVTTNLGRSSVRSDAIREAFDDAAKIYDLT